MTTTSTLVPTFFASRSHYRDHLEPIAAAMGTEVIDTPGTGPVVVASSIDLWRCRGRRVIFVEHGAGQTYSNNHPAYSGGRDRGDVVLFICPSVKVSWRNFTAYPKVQSVAVGCPKMDRWHIDPKPGGDAIGIAFHWFTGGVAPEARSAFGHYQEALGALQAAFPGRVLGTGHPRIVGRLRRSYEAAGIPLVPTEEVFERCGVLVTDNSSVGWEFASLDRPVVWLNAPWYRRGVEHGLRFWQYADTGLQVDEPRELVEGVTLALDDPEPFRSRRREVIPGVYAFTDGTSAQRAADAIREAMWSRS